MKLTDKANISIWENRDWQFYILFLTFDTSEFLQQTEKKCCTYEAMKKKKVSKPTFHSKLIQMLGATFIYSY